MVLICSMPESERQMPSTQWSALELARGRRSEGLSLLVGESTLLGATIMKVLVMEATTLAAATVVLVMWAGEEVVEGKEGVGDDGKR